MDWEAYFPIRLLTWYRKRKCLQTKPECKLSHVSHIERHILYWYPEYAKASFFVRQIKPFHHQSRFFINNMLEPPTVRPSNHQSIGNESSISLAYNSYHFPFTRHKSIYANGLAKDVNCFLCLRLILNGMLRPGITNDSQLLSKFLRPVNNKKAAKNVFLEIGKMRAAEDTHFAYKQELKIGLNWLSPIQIHLIPKQNPFWTRFSLLNLHWPYLIPTGRVLCGSMIYQHLRITVPLWIKDWSHSLNEITILCKEITI